MSFKFSPKINTNGLVLYLDSVNTKSYVSGSTIWSDLRSPGTNVTLFNNPSFNVNDAKGSIVFNGSTNYDTIPASTTTAFSNNFTISVWVKVNGFHGTGYNGIAGRFGPTTNFNGYLVECNNQFGGNKFAFTIATANSFTRINSDSNLTLGLWYNVVGTNTAGVNRLYVNNVLQSTTANVNVTTSATQDFAIGRYYAEFNSYYHNGSISNVMVYNRPLSLSEIQQNYNTLKSRFGL